MGVTIKPFRAVRPLPKCVSAVAALPYDVMNTEEARVMTEGNPRSFLRVDKAEIDLPRETDVYSDAVYKKAKENLDSLIKDSMLQEEKPCLYIYRLTGYGQTQTGLAACVSAAEYELGLIKKHELTRDDKEKDRINHMLACEAHTGPIFLAYDSRNSTKPADIMREYVKQEPAYDFTSEDGVRHQLWVVENDGTQNDLISAFGEIPVLYIADGHHRNESASKVAKKLNGNAVASGAELNIDAEHNFYLAVIFPHDELAILDYNRVVKDFNGLSSAAFLEKIKANWDVQKSDAAVKPEKKNIFGMYMEKQWYRLSAKNPPGKTDVINSLDCAVLQNTLLSPVLGIENPKTDKRIDFVGGIRGLAELEKRVDSGEMAVAFSLFPTSMDELMAVADADKIMPPKSTWFEPKLRSGILIHLFN